MDRDLMIVLIWLAAALSLLVLIQVAVLGALFLMLRTVRSTARQIDRNLHAKGVDLYDLAGKLYRLLGDLGTATKNAAEIVKSFKDELAEVRSRLARVDQSMSKLLAQLERGSETLKRALDGPVIQCRATKLPNAVIR
jgi:DNA anti-recombination protein RmuC